MSMWQRRMLKLLERQDYWERKEKCKTFGPKIVVLIKIKKNPMGGSNCGYLRL